MRLLSLAHRDLSQRGCNALPRSSLYDDHLRTAGHTDGVCYKKFHTGLSYDLNSIAFILAVVIDSTRGKVGKHADSQARLALVTKS
ncbi:hypothetical protein P3T16_004544 [Paraburkholderia sp. GAS42]|jgi:hypothetical protein